MKGLRVGYFPAWMKEDPATDVDRAALETVRKVGMMPVEVSLPDWPYDSLNLILFAEAAAAFEELTLSGEVRQLKVQVPDAWPNTVSPIAIPLGGGFRAGRPDAAARSRRRWRGSLSAGGPAAGAVAARRDAGDHQLHGASFADAARGIRGGVGGAQRLGARPGASAAEVFAAAARAARGDADRATVR